MGDVSTTKKGEQFKQLKRTIGFMCDALVLLRHCRFNGVTPDEGEWQRPALVKNVLERIIPYMEIRKIRVEERRGPDNVSMVGLPQTWFQCSVRDWTARNERSNGSRRQGTFPLFYPTAFNRPIQQNFLMK